jgi:iron-sulfur cluster assembly protein
MFKVTPSAAEQIQKATHDSGAEGMALRLAVQQQADGGFEYRMGFDEEQEIDIVFQSEGVSIVMEPEYVPLLEETVLDFVALDGEEDHQFVFLNPKDPNYQPPSLD